VLARVARAVRAEAAEVPGLVPALLEHGFGGGAKAPALEVSAGGEAVRLRGRIDRVDASPERLLVIDYKSGRDGKAHAAKLDPDAFGVESFQVPAYLLVAARDLPGRRRLAATYQLLGAAERLEPVELDADDPRLVASTATATATSPPTATATPTSTATPTPTPTALPFAAAVVDTVRRIREGRFPTRPGGCDHCPHRAICRLDASALPEEGA
jgi:ATP-dependent helicase/DNAse subunit B